MKLERLTKAHNREDFTSKSPEIDNWLRTQASQFERKNRAHTWVLTEDGKCIAGFFTLTHEELDISDEENLSKKLKTAAGPRQKLSVVLVGYLAKDKTHGADLSLTLIMEAVLQLIERTSLAPVHGIILDPLTPNLVPLYERLGFKVVDEKLRMLLSLV